MFRALKLLGILVLAALVIEASFRFAALLAGKPGGEDLLARSHDVVLCVGDSHTWGLGRGYPARLGDRLGTRDARYRVVNMGVPGSNTAQVRTRLPSYLDRLGPRLVVLWAGVNNKYNRADTDVWQEAGVEKASSFRSLLDSSLFLRFLRLWRNDRELDRQLDDVGTYVKPDDGGGGKKVEGDPGRMRFERTLLGRSDFFDHVRGDYLPGEEVTRVTELDVRAIIEEVRSRGIPIVVVTYPADGGWFLEANRGIRAAAKSLDVPIVESPEVLRRLKTELRERGEPIDKRRFFDPSAHPQQFLYDAIADAVLELVDAQKLLGPDEGPHPSAAAPQSNLPAEDGPPASPPPA